MQLALDPIRRGEWDARETCELLHEAGIGILSGMMGMRGEDYSTLESIRRTGGVRLDEHWAENVEAAKENARIAHVIGTGLVTFHAGFLPGPDELLLRRLMVERLRTIVDCFADQGVQVALETGQEDAQTLLSVLQEIDRPTIGVNFDPANMILYGMGDPVESLGALLPYVRQMHVKDALPTELTGQWGREVPVGQGAIPWKELFAVIELDSSGLRPFDFVIEREAGDDRIGDVRKAKQLVENLIP